MNNHKQDPLSADRWERRALKTAYMVMSLYAAGFIYVMWRAKQIIDSSNGAVNSSTYFWTHLGTFLIEVALWVILARAAIHLKSYTRMVKRSDDGRGLDYIANALLIGLVYAMIFAVTSTVKTLFWHSPHLEIATTITNLLPVVLVLALSVLVFVGSVKLVRLLPSRVNILGNPGKVLTVAASFIAAAIYARYLYSMAPSLLDDDGLHHFAMSQMAVLLSYILPYLIVWLLGLAACLNITHYANNVEGVLYKPLFRSLSQGLTISFIGAYLVQIFYVSNLVSNRPSPGLVMIVTTLLLIIYGCYMVYGGTNQLERLEQGGPA